MSKYLHADTVKWQMGKSLKFLYTGVGLRTPVMMHTTPLLTRPAGGPSEIGYVQYVHHICRGAATLQRHLRCTQRATSLTCHVSHLEITRSDTFSADSHSDLCFGWDSREWDHVHTGRHHLAAKVKSLYWNSKRAWKWTPYGLNIFRWNAIQVHY